MRPPQGLPAYSPFFSVKSSPGVPRISPTPLLQCGLLVYLPVVRRLSFAAPFMTLLDDVRLAISLR